MRKIVTVIFTILFSTTLFSQNDLKESVAIVRPNYSKERTDFLSSMSSTLMNNGYVSSARVLRSRSYGGGFGSGFVYQSESGEKYIITNKHVISGAEKATVEFVTDNGDTITYNGREIIAISSDLDIAIISFGKIPTIIPATIGLESIQDGDEVWSAGYPGLGKKPTWQLGKGIISNKGIKDIDFADPAITTIIQHTAQIDPGSSGGPLLVRKADASYTVVGINTWKARNREGANFAIPIKAVNDFISSVLTKGETDTKALIEKQAAEILKQTDYKAIAKYISPEFIYQMTGASFNNMMNKATKEAKDEIVKNLRDGAPMEAFRLLIADAIAQKVNKDVFSLTGVNNIGESTASASFKTAKKSYTGKWAKDQEGWGISSFSAIEVDKKGSDKSLDGKDFPERNLALKVSFSLTDDYGNAYEILYENIYSQYFTWHSLLGVGTQYVLEEDWDNYISGDDPKMIKVKKMLFTGEMGLGGQFPIGISRVYLIPYAKAALGFNVGEYGNIYAGLRGGMNVGLSLSKNHVLYIGAEYVFKKPMLSFDDYDDNPNISLLGINLGFYF